MGEDTSVEQAFDRLTEMVGFDPAAPVWTPELVRLHEYSLKKGLPIMPEHFYTPVFSPAALPSNVWTGTFREGVDYDVEEQLAFLAETQAFGTELSELRPNCDGDADSATRFFWNNGQFGHGDAVLYYSMIRSLRPARVVEVGAGYSTLLASEAVTRNGAGSVTCVEPHPRAFLESGLPGVELVRLPAQEAPAEIFGQLREGDILFIDGSHVSKTGSDVNHLLLRVLPSLRAGVVVHIHDIFLPFEYPKAWVEERRYWNEQYVLAALLSHSRKFAVVAANYFLWRTALDRLIPLMPDVPGLQPGGSSFWVRCVA